MQNILLMKNKIMLIARAIYQTLENKIIPTFFDKDENGISKRWMEIMKQSIMSNAGRYSTARMLIDYTNKFTCHFAICTTNITQIIISCRI